MKKTILIFLIFGLSKGFGAVYTWTAAISGVASNSLNWSSGGVPGTPGSGDNVIFDGTSTTTCTWDIAQVGSFSVNAGYTGSITISGNRTIRGNIVINSGTVTSSSGTLTRNLVGGSAAFILGSGGTFNHNNGTFVLQLESGDNFVFSGNVVLNTLSMAHANTPGERNIDFGTTSVNNLLFSGAVDPISFQGDIHIKTGYTLSAANYTDPLLLTNNANFIFDGATASIVGASASGSAWLPNLEINTTGSYSMTSNLNVLGDWTHTNGTLNVGTSTVNLYSATAVISGTAAAFDNLAIDVAGSVTFPAGEVRISKNFTNNGAVTFPSTSILGLNGGSTSQTISGNAFTAGSIRAHSGSRTITLSAPVTISDSLKLENNVTFASGGNLTLQANNTLSARVAQMASGASVSGNVTVQTFVPGPTTGWANWGVNGVNGQTIGNWDTQIPMTCDGCIFSPTIIPGTFYSISSWSENLGDYDTTVTVATALTPAQGFWVYVGSSTTTTTDFTLNHTGTLVQGAVGIALTRNLITTGTPTVTNPFPGYNLVSNPYACPISWTKVRAANGGTNSVINDAIYVYNADLGTTTSFALGLSSDVTGITDVIPTGQAFYVETTAATTMSFTESVKTTSNTNAFPVLKSMSNSGIGQIFRLKLKGINDYDQTAFRIHPDASTVFDRNLDAHKIFQSPGYAGYPGPYTKYTTISSKDASGEDYSINSIPLLTSSVSIPVLAKVSTSGTYTISAFDFQDLDVCVSLIDKTDHSSHDLRTSPYVFTIEDTTSVPRFDIVLCRDLNLNLVSVKENEALSSVLISQDETGPFVTTAFTQATKATISVYNIVGQKLMKDLVINGTTTTTHLNLDLHSQVVLIKVSTDEERSVKKLVVH